MQLDEVFLLNRSPNSQLVYLKKRLINPLTNMQGLHRSCIILKAAYTGNLLTARAFKDFPIYLFPDSERVNGVALLKKQTVSYLTMN